MFLIKKNYSLFQNFVEKFSSTEKANEFEEFFRINKTPELQKSIEKSIEKIRINAKWLNRDIIPIREYFNKNSFDSAKLRTV